MPSVALLTLARRSEIEGFERLCESVDRHARGYERHYVIVEDDDLALFSKYAGGRLVVTPASRHLPSWLIRVPRLFARGDDRAWLSLRSKPVDASRIRQILTIAGVLASAEERVCVVETDKAFASDFDARLYAGGARAPLYVERMSIRRDSATQAPLVQSALQLLGLPEPAFPADDYLGDILAFDKATAKAMTDEIRLATGLDWRLALCRRSEVPAYLIYGHFVAHAPHFLALHEVVEHHFAGTHWEEKQLDERWARELLASASTAGPAAETRDTISATNAA